MYKPSGPKLGNMVLGKSYLLTELPLMDDISYISTLELYISLAWWQHYDVMHVVK